MIPVILGVLGVGAAATAIYKAVKSDNDSSDYTSTYYHDNSTQRMREAREEAERQREQERLARQQEQLMQSLHGDLQQLQREFFQSPSIVHKPNSTQIRRFIDFDVEQVATAKAALNQLAGAQIIFKDFEQDTGAVRKELKALAELKQLLASL